MANHSQLAAPTVPGLHSGPRKVTYSGPSTGGSFTPGNGKQLLGNLGNTYATNIVAYGLKAHTLACNGVAQTKGPRKGYCPCGAIGTAPAPVAQPALLGSVAGGSPKQRQHLANMAALGPTKAAAYLGSLPPAVAVALVALQRNKPKAKAKAKAKAMPGTNRPGKANSRSTKHNPAKAANLAHAVTVAAQHSLAIGLLGATALQQIAVVAPALVAYGQYSGNFTAAYNAA